MNSRINSFIIFFSLITISSAQFSQDSKSINGTINWNKMLYDGHDMGTLLVIAPSLGFMIRDNFAVNMSVSLTTFSFEGESQTVGSFGLGTKYYKKINKGAGYGGGSFNFKGFESPNSLLIEFGFLKGLNNSIFLDFGFDYLLGLGEDKFSTLTLGVGIATFF